MSLPPNEPDLIARLLDLPKDERTAALQRALEETPGLRDRMPEIARALATAEQQSESRAPLSPGAAAFAFESALSAHASEEVGTHIGPYKLLQEIGEGGFGVVWMAEQQEPIRRRVALKIIKSGMDTREVIARFEAERQALALMDHPHIARVFDAGATETGRPYFAMELVRGVPITRYCDENRLPAGERLRLFISVCLAVQHAHQKGVIHRDLKPSNILVTLHDGAPIPKVIDFGIAKATSAHLTDKTLFTQFHAFIGTPAYTSPEQMEMSGLDVDTRSDIYSLGVLLYELLAGRTPFDPDALAKSGLEAMRRTIREIDPPRPSTRLSTLTDADRLTVAEKRSTDPAKLSVLLRGDLDWVVMRALEKDRTRRYESAAALAADVQRHLASEPVAARPPSSAYRLRKFIRRHTVGFFSTVAVAVSLVAGLIASSYLLVREHAARTRAVVAERAEGELRREGDIARELEKKRSSRTALDLAERLLHDGRISDALAYLVHAARLDPANAVIAPRLASVLASHNFLLPAGDPFLCGSRAFALRFTSDGKSLHVGTEDGTLRILDAISGQLRREFRLEKPVKLGGWMLPRNQDGVAIVRFIDNTLGVFNLAAGKFRWPPLQLEPRVWPDPDPAGLSTPVGLSPDGRWIYARGRNEFWLWDAATGEPRWSRTFTDTFDGSDFAADGKALAITSRNALRRWTLTGAADPIEAPLIPSPPGRTFYRIPRFSPDGRQVAVCYGGNAAIDLYDFATGAKIQTLEIESDAFFLRSFGYLADGRILAGAGQSTVIWNPRTGTRTSIARLSGATFRDSDISTDGATLLTTDSDGTTRLWETDTGGIAAEPALQEHSGFFAALSPDGTRVAIGTSDGLIRLMHVGRGAARPLMLPRAAPAMPAPFLDDVPARLLWFMHDRARILDVQSGREVAGGFNYPEKIAPPSNEAILRMLAPNKKRMVVHDARGQWRAWELSAAGVTRVVPLENASTENAVPTFSANGNLVTLIRPGSVSAPVWNTNTGTLAGTPYSHPSALVYLSVIFSPDEKKVIFGAADGAIVSVDVATGRAVTIATPRPDAPTFLWLSPDHTTYLSVNTQHEVRRWDATTGVMREPILNLMDENRGVFSPSGRQFAAFSSGQVSVWDSRTGESAGPVFQPGGRGVQFSPDDERLLIASGGRSAQVFDIRSGHPITDPLIQERGRVVRADFSPDGCFVRSETTAGIFSINSIPPRLPDGTPTPEWLLQLATLCATKTIAADGEVRDAPEALATIRELRRQLTALPQAAPLAEWGRWILDDRADRPIAPGFTIKPDEANALTAKLAAEATAPVVTP